MAPSRDETSRQTGEDIPRIASVRGGMLERLEVKYGHDGGLAHAGYISALAPRPLLRLISIMSAGASRMPRNAELNRDEMNCCLWQEH
ncbi:hypothetical protein AAFF_G00433980 [Aldrovandia affinis]|uniref:Uncharacterized protein n=1 Tax=Aldrovandia affinis TaxID=143900 RepID=A0AAD7WIW6_9TELE|nr:hypothetical protein AAFF_G00433980 [Aldrovandia affinis]